MRNRLADLEGQELRVYAQIVRYGNRRGSQGATVLLRNLKTVSRFLCDHQWIDIDAEFRTLGEVPRGAHLSFIAVVGRYDKGRGVHRSTDFELKSPRSFRIEKHRPRP